MSRKGEAVTCVMHATDIKIKGKRTVNYLSKVVARALETFVDKIL